MRATAILLACVIIIATSSGAHASLLSNPLTAGLSSFGFPALGDASLTGSAWPSSFTSWNDMPGMFGYSGNVPSGFSNDLSSFGLSPGNIFGGGSLSPSFSISDLLGSGSSFMPSQSDYTSGIEGLSPNKTNNYTESSNGKTIKMKVGDTIHVQLPARVDQGYSWNLSTTKGLNVTSSRMYMPQGDLAFTTSGVQITTTQEWDILAIKKGSQKINATYMQSTPGKGDRTFVLYVIVE